MMMMINAVKVQNVAQDAASEDFARMRVNAIISAGQLDGSHGAMKTQIAAKSAASMASASPPMHAHLSHQLGSSGSSVFQEVSLWSVLLSALSCAL